MPGVEYKPGDVVNGHILGNDNQWHPVAEPSAASPVGLPEPEGPSSRHQDGYWARYRRRWLKTGLVFAVLTASAPIFLHLNSPEDYPTLVAQDVFVGALTGL